MSKITDYTILSGAVESVLAIQVIQLIKQGWTPQGGVTIHNSGSKVIAFHQAMIKVA